MTSIFWDDWTTNQLWVFDWSWLVFSLCEKTVQKVRSASEQSTPLETQQITLQKIDVGLSENGFWTIFPNKATGYTPQVQKS